MARKTNRPSESVPQGDGSSRRDLLKRALVLLGAGALIQPNGGISGLALADEPPLSQKPKPKIGDKGSDLPPKPSPKLSPKPNPKKVARPRPAHPKPAKNIEVPKKGKTLELK